jgi:hypothetical protein
LPEGINVTATIETRISARIPGPDRKRTPKWYDYQLIYRNLLSKGPGCVMIWSVGGGRDQYQVALERTERDELRWHCTCADCVYRRDKNPQHVCKHVHGATKLLEQMPTSEGGGMKEEG